MSLSIGQKRQLEKPSQPFIQKKKFHPEGEILSPGEIVERLSVSLTRFEKNYDNITAKTFLKKPEFYLAFHCSTGVLMPYFPGAMDRLTFKVTMPRDKHFESVLIQGPEMDIPQNAANIMQTVLRIISSESKLQPMRQKLSISDLTRYITQNPVGTILNMDLVFLNETSLKDRPLRLKERVVLHCSDSKERIASVSEFQEDHIVFSIGESEEIVKNDDLSSEESPILFREEFAEKKMVCHCWKVMTKVEELQKIEAEELLEFWNSQASESI